jgi:hypothetical protein
VDELGFPFPFFQFPALFPFRTALVHVRELRLVTADKFVGVSFEFAKPIPFDCNQLFVVVVVHCRLTPTDDLS